ncbi:predicted protein [Nematostella vectensis]|uniref:Diphthine--ammonia ligase n=1 Tax=Nematostella vectensis TaxID=45351 RepID=A7RG89_NEMVE|nr:predicted protein [Nematostella vectensis]|eukprot:XP_001641551.1 predicted protein [Nematostella vectensis]
MRVVALISGGKDSCYNMMECVRNGHEIVALANLKPEKKDELDSYMFQSVGHNAINLYAEAMELPLYQRIISGSSVELGKNYKINKDDEVEDLFELLKSIQEKMEFDAIAVGAILSDYQRVRVEHVCTRLGIASLSYLWRRDQKELYTEMLSSGLVAIIIKVAVMGLSPRKHLGLTMEQLFPTVCKLNNEIGMNICGEGGEFESFTLDCPLFKKRIIIDESEVVIHSDDAFAEVGFLRLKAMHLEDKQMVI